MQVIRTVVFVFSASVLATAILVACGNDKGTPTPAPTPPTVPPVTVAPTPEPTPPPPPPEPKRTENQIVMENLKAAPDLTSAISIVRPMMNDSDPKTKQGPGAAMLAGWMNDHRDWKELNALDSTKYKLVQKDPEAERGKVLCMRGSIIQIKVERSARLTDLVLYEGGLISHSDVLRFVAVGSTGDLVERSKARFCGVVTGTQSYRNSGGGVTHAVRAVGMFDLKENRK